MRREANDTVWIVEDSEPDWPSPIKRAEKRRNETSEKARQRMDAVYQDILQDAKRSDGNRRYLKTKMAEAGEQQTTTSIWLVAKDELFTTDWDTFLGYSNGSLTIGHGGITQWREFLPPDTHQSWYLALKQFSDATFLLLPEFLAVLEEPEGVQRPAIHELEIKWVNVDGSFVAALVDVRPRQIKDGPDFHICYALSRPVDEFFEAVSSLYDAIIAKQRYRRKFETWYETALAMSTTWMPRNLKIIEHHIRGSRADSNPSLYESKWVKHIDWDVLHANLGMRDRLKQAGPNCQGSKYMTDPFANLLTCSQPGEQLAHQNMHMAQHTGPSPDANASFSSNGLLQQREFLQGGRGLSRIPEDESGMLTPRHSSYDTTGKTDPSKEQYYGPEAEALGLTNDNMWPGNPWLEYVARHPKLARLLPNALPSRRSSRYKPGGGGSYRPRDGGSNQGKSNWRSGPQNFNRGQRLPASSSVAPPPGLHISPSYPSFSQFGSAAPPVVRRNEAYAVHQPALPHHSHNPAGGYGNQYAYGPPQFAGFNHQSRQPGYHHQPHAGNAQYPPYSVRPAVPSQSIRPLTDTSKNASHSAPGAPRQHLHHSFNEAGDHDNATWKAREAADTGSSQPRG